jgi:hypothetical protein
MFDISIFTLQKRIYATIVRWIERCCAIGPIPEGA